MIHDKSDLIKVKIEESTDERCTVWMRRKDSGFELETTWTMFADAHQAGVVKDDSGSVHYPGTLLRWRTVGVVADVVCPDIIGGMKRADELGAKISADGDVIEGQWSPAAQPAPSINGATTVTLDDLLAKYGPEAIMAANDGGIPGTDGEVAAVAAKLEAGNA